MSRYRFVLGALAAAAVITMSLPYLLHNRHSSALADALLHASHPAGALAAFGGASGAASGDGHPPWEAARDKAAQALERHDAAHKQWVDAQAAHAAAAPAAAAVPALAAAPPPAPAARPPTREEIKNAPRGELKCGGKPIDSEVIYWRVVPGDKTYVREDAGRCCSYYCYSSSRCCA